MATNYTKARQNVPPGWVYLGDNLKRYLLGQPSDKNILIFGVNPSTATPQQPDPTIKKVLKILDKHFNGYGWIMMNIFPQVTPNPQDLIYDQNLESENLQVLDFVCKKFTIEKIWCAWGNLIDSKVFLHNCQQNIFSCLKNQNQNQNYQFIHYGALTKKNNPRHPLYMSLNNNFISL